MSRMRTRIAALAAAGVAAAALAPMPATSAVADDDLGSRFTLAVMPDTQFYSRYAESDFEPRYGTNPYAVQTEWLAENADELHIPFVAHLGDLVDRATVDGEWHVADAAMQTLDDASLPYSVLAGNHDVLNSSTSLTDVDYDLDAEPFLTWFGETRGSSQSTWGGSDPTGMNQFHIFEAEGQEYMVLALSWRASDQTIAWANEVIAQHPDVPVILTSHQLIDIENDGVTARETDYGLKLWDELIRGNDQIFLTLNGHFHGAARQTKPNDFGHDVTQIVIDYQMAYDGGNGYLGLFEFDLTAGEIQVQTASPWVTSKSPDVLTSFDQPFLEEPNQQFTVDIDFAERFGGFAPDFTIGDPVVPDLSQAARDVLLDGFTAPEPIENAEPTSRDDYPEVDGTLAHWRFGSLDEGMLAEGATVPDETGDNDMHRAMLDEAGSPTAAAADVTISDDAHQLSSDGAAVCFADSDRRTERFSYLATDADAPANRDQLENGYTIETFLKLDPSWTEDANAWTKALTRAGNRSTIDGYPWSQWDYTVAPVELGISNLREFQYSHVGVDTEKGDRTAWSGEIMTGKWAHVALVNDADARTVTMYVDGAPVLRNASDVVGHSLNGDLPWVIGADWVDDAAAQGWNGCVGETRVIDHPTGPEEWLTARADLDALAVDLGDTAHHLRTVTGTGEPGAAVSVVVEPGAEMPGRPKVRAGEAIVADDGTWAVTLDHAVVRPGPYELTARQTHDGDEGEPVVMAFEALPGRG